MLESRRDGGTALHLAATAGHSPVVQHLLQAGADKARMLLSGGRTPLSVAMLKGHEEVARLLKTMLS